MFYFDNRGVLACVVKSFLDIYFNYKRIVHESTREYCFHHLPKYDIDKIAYSRTDFLLAALLLKGIDRLSDLKAITLSEAARWFCTIFNGMFKPDMNVKKKRCVLQDHN